MHTSMGMSLADFIAESNNQPFEPDLEREEISQWIP